MIRPAKLTYHYSILLGYCESVLRIGMTVEPPSAQDVIVRICNLLESVSYRRIEAVAVPELGNAQQKRGTQVTEAGEPWFESLKRADLNVQPSVRPQAAKAITKLYNSGWSTTGSHHAIMVVSSFFENVATHLFEKRELAPGEKAANTVLHFNPNPPSDMIIACLWARWTGKDEPDLYSFAAITDDPPPEVAATGHNRMIISIKESNVDDWLNTDVVNESRLQEILSDRERPYYEHRIAA